MHALQISSLGKDSRNFRNRPKRHGVSTHKDMYTKFLTKDNIRKINRKTIEYDFDCTSKPHKWRCDFTREYKFRKHHVDASDMGRDVCWKTDFDDPNRDFQGRVPIPNCSQLT